MPEITSCALRNCVLLSVIFVTSVVGIGIVTSARSYTAEKVLVRVASGVEGEILRTYASMVSGTVTTFECETLQIGFDYVVSVDYREDGDAYTVEVCVRSSDTGREVVIELPKLCGYARSLSFDKSARALALEVTKL